MTISMVLEAVIDMENSWVLWTSLGLDWTGLELISLSRGSWAVVVVAFAIRRDEYVNAQVAGIEA